MSSRPWPPARAISSARRASGWPRTSARSGTARPDRPGAPAPGAAPVGRPARRLDRARPAAARRRPRRAPAGADQLHGVAERRARRCTSMPVDEARLVDRRRRRRRPAGSRAGRAPRPSAGCPGTGRTSPPSDSSPISADPARRRAGPAPSRAGSRCAIARSSDAPALRRSAGARLTVIRRGGWTKPALRMRPADPLPGLLERGIGEPDDREPGQPGRDVDLDPDQPAVEAVRASRRGRWPARRGA